MKDEDQFPILVAQDGPLKGQRWIISRTMVIGRDPACEINVQDRQVSRFHARITPTPEGVTIEDLGSKNGTNHNGAELATPIMLQDGDVLGIAIAQQFLFLTSDATMPLDEGMARGGRLLMDQKSHQVWVNQQQLAPPLSAQQYKLLWLLYQNEGRVISRTELAAAVWGEDQIAGVSEQALDALIRRLRDRIAAHDATHQYIDSVRGHGVRLDNPPIGD